MRTKGLDGELYFMIMIDDYTGMKVDNFLKKKSEAFECFKIYKELVKNENDLKKKCLRSNNGGEFTSKLFQQHELLNKMELPKERIESYRKWVEQC